MTELSKILEAILFVSGEPLQIPALAQALEVTEIEVSAAADELASVKAAADEAAANAADELAAVTEKLTAAETEIADLKAKLEKAQQSGKYTIYNKTGEVVTGLYIAYNETGEKSENLVGEGLDVDGVIEIEFSLPADVDGHHALTLTFVTASGRTGEFATLSIEEAPITLLAADAMSGATPIKFFAPEK